MGLKPSVPAYLFQIPIGYQILVFSRSGQGFNHNLSLVNSVGVIDNFGTSELGVKREMTVKLIMLCIRRQDRASTIGPYLNSRPLQLKPWNRLNAVQRVLVQLVVKSVLNTSP